MFADMNFVDHQNAEGLSTVYSLPVSMIQKERGSSDNFWLGSATQSHKAVSTVLLWVR